MGNLPITPDKALPPALLKVKPGREQLEQFKARLNGLVAQISDSPDESEEHHKNHIADFLKYAFKFPAYFINTNEGGKAQEAPVMDEVAQGEAV